MGAVRKLDAGSGKFIWEQLVAISDLERFYTYTILPYGASNRPLETCAFPGPPLNYKATLRAKPVTADGVTSFLLPYNWLHCVQHSASILLFEKQIRHGTC